MKEAVGVPDAVYNPPSLWHISSPQSASEYLGVSDSRGSKVEFRSATIQEALAGDRKDNDIIVCVHT